MIHTVLLKRTDTDGEVENAGEAGFTRGVHEMKTRDFLAPFLYPIGC